LTAFSFEQIKGFLSKIDNILAAETFPFAKALKQGPS